MNWQPIETAPKDGTTILVASAHRVGESSYGECRRQHDGHVANGGQPCWRAEDRQKIFPGVVRHWMPMPDRPGSKIPTMGTESRAIINGIHFTLIECEHVRGMVKMIVYRPLPTQSWAYLTHPVNVAVNLKGLINTCPSVLVSHGRECLEYPRMIITTIHENIELNRLIIVGLAVTEGRDQWHT